MEECVDGEYQDFKSKNGAYVREHFFGRYPETRSPWSPTWSDDEIWALTPAAGTTRARSTRPTRRPSTQGPADADPRQDGQGLRHGRGRRGPDDHPPAEEDGRRHALRAVPRPLRDPVTDDQQVAAVAVPEADRGKPRRSSPTSASAASRARRLHLPARRQQVLGITRAVVPPLSAFDAQLKGTGEGREISTTMAFVRVLNTLLRDKTPGQAHVCRSSPTRAARSAWRACSASTASSPRSASCTARRTPTAAHVLQGGPAPARCCRKASTRPAPCRRGSRRPPVVLDVGTSR